MVAVARLASARPVPSRAPLPIPALTITRSRPPSSARSSAKTRGTAAWSSTSSARTATVMSGWAVVSSLRNSSSSSSRRAHSARSRPLRANSRAMPAPSPELAPVIKILVLVMGRP
ncbi:Uncharacterised protein [Mycobacteroides abscessus subsp. abscessus]|nr:Uncharacterised protein [Mycobacteroides abscessus subsp. abscessus]